MKPHIKIVAGQTYRYRLWVCDGLGRRGLGTDPSDAYWDWVAQGSEAW